MDYYSRHLEIMYLSGGTSSLVIAKLKSMFARWGIPQEAVSDNGPQFSLESFVHFAQSYGFKHTTLSPYYPPSNGLAESAVKIGKNILCQQDPCLALMVYRSTTLRSTGYSQSEIMSNRQIGTTLPTLPMNIQPSDYDKEKVKRKLRLTRGEINFIIIEGIHPSHFLC